MLAFVHFSYRYHLYFIFSPFPFLFSFQFFSCAISGIVPWCRLGQAEYNHKKSAARQLRFILAYFSVEHHPSHDRHGRGHKWHTGYVSSSSIYTWTPAPRRHSLTITSSATNKRSIARTDCQRNRGCYGPISRNGRGYAGRHVTRIPFADAFEMRLRYTIVKYGCGASKRRRGE